MGDHRTAYGRGVELIWPRLLSVPTRPPALLYLDLNHWINLAKAYKGRGSDHYEVLLDSLEKARETRTAMIVLSTSFVEELSAIKNPRQRQDLVEAVDRLTDFEYLAGLPDIFRLELDSFFSAKLGGTGLGWGAVDLVGKSIFHSLGRVGGLRIIDEVSGLDVTEQARNESSEGVTDWLKALERQAERQLLAGPKDAELVELRANGYAPERARESHHNNALIEQYFADHQLDQHWRKGRLLDVLAARHVSLELIDMLQTELDARGATLDDLVARCDQVIELPLSMPASSVFVGLKTQLHRDPTRRWTDNDLHDIAALAVAIPYCDIVFTDSAIRQAAISAKLDLLMGTGMPRTPLELAEMLRTSV